VIWCYLTPPAHPCAIKSIKAFIVGMFRLQAEFISWDFELEATWTQTPLKRESLYITWHISLPKSQWWTCYTETKNPYGLLFDGNLCEYLSSCLSAALQFPYVLLALLVNDQTSSKKDHAQKVLDLVSLSILPSFLVLVVFLSVSHILTLFCVPLSFLVSLNLLF
jgi:hypothetical protein